MYSAKEEALVLRVILQEYITILERESIAGHLKFNHNSNNLNMFPKYDPQLLEESLKYLYDSKTETRKVKMMLSFLEELIIGDNIIEDNEKKMEHAISIIKENKVVIDAIDRINEGLLNEENPLFMSYAFDYPENKEKFDTLFANNILTKYEYIYYTVMFQRYMATNIQIKAYEQRSQK